MPEETHRAVRGSNLHQFTFQVSPSPAPWAPSQHLADKGRMLREVQWFQLSQRTHLSLLPALLTCSPIARSTDAAHRAEVLLLSCGAAMGEGRCLKDVGEETSLLWSIDLHIFLLQCQPVPCKGHQSSPRGKGLMWA